MNLRRIRPGAVALAVAVLAMAGAASAFGATRASALPDAASPLAGATSLTSDRDGYCAIVTGGGVDCWGFGANGELGNGTVFSGGNHGSATPVRVTGVGGTGTLTGVRSLVSDGYGFCALLGDGGVDCWGQGESGELGDGHFYRTSPAVPVQVEGVGGSGVLAGVVSLTGATYFESPSYCALLSTGGVDCWGGGAFGALGDGKSRNGFEAGSATPVAVLGVGRVGTLSGAVGLASDDLGYCVLLGSGGVDCWGYGYFGDLGNGRSYRANYEFSAVPVRVVGVGRIGALTGVLGLTGYYQGYCARLSGGKLDCWGVGGYGQLGDGKRHNNGVQSSAVPVPVVGVGRSGILSGISSLYTNRDTTCAAVGGGAVDCWGYAAFGKLGNGTRYTNETPYPAVPFPVPVKGVGGIGTLSGASSLTMGDATCALVNGGAVDCWGVGRNGALGNGKFYASSDYPGSPLPVQVKGLGGAGTLDGVTSLTTNGGSECAVVTAGGVDCWGYGEYGELGNGRFYSDDQRGSAVPVQVLSPAV